MSIFTLSILFNRERRIEPVSFGSTSPETATPWDPSQIGLEQAPTGASSNELVNYTAEDVEQAFVRGHQEGKDECNATVESMRAQLGSALNRVAHAAEKLTKAYHQEAIELALAIAESVIGDALNTNPDALTHVVQQALQQMPQVDYAVIQCHPEDLEAIDAMRPASFSQHGKPLTLQITAHPSVERGGVVITFEEGAIDAQPSVALTLIREAIETSLAGPRQEESMSTESIDDLEALEPMDTPDGAELEEDRPAMEGDEE